MGIEAMPSIAGWAPASDAGLQSTAVAMLPWAAKSSHAARSANIR